ncbi:uncharacterized protein LOC114544301 [Dendronephthya gigantea]|uniref:uncharacterized protein LOC114544301 n=1 Tax=Dendronephthya gigantea TaxID=151771 RepID=UPI00106C057C|nr:uncharacterized protein LOC114544301 [Dendronephthya gigantea]
MKAFYFCSLIIVLLSIAKPTLTVGYDINGYVKKCIESATKAADLKYHTEHTMEPPDIRYDIFPSLDETWVNDPKSYCVLPYILFDPLCQFNALLEGNTILCPKCETDDKMCENNRKGHLVNTGVWKNGRLQRLNPRIIFGLTSPVLLVYKQYSCDLGHTEINSIDVDVVKQVNNYNVPFTLSHKSGFTNRLVDYLEELLDAGLSSNQICEIIQRCYKKAFYERAQRYYRDHNIAINIGLTKEVSQNFPTFEQMDLPCVGHTLVGGAIISRFKSEEVFYRHFFSTIPARWISCDHTFKATSNIGYLRESDNKWVKLFQSLFCVLNEKGTVIQWKFTKTEGTAELENLFQQLSKRFLTQNNILEGIFLDNCCKWTSFLSKHFPGVPIKLDIFHAVQRLVRKIPKCSKYSSGMAKEYGLVFRQPGDIGKKRSRPSPSPDVISKNLEKFSNKWESVKNAAGLSVLTKEMLKEIKNIQVHINKGCLSDIPVGCGTNKNERLHRDLKKIVATNRIGLPLLYTKMFRMLYRLAQENEKEMSSIQVTKTQKNEHILITEYGQKLEYFGVERCLEEIERSENNQRPARKVKGLESYSRKEVEEILDGISILQRNIKCKWIVAEHDYSERSEKEEYDTLEYLKQGLSFWRSSESIREIVPRHLLTTKQVQQDSSVETIEQEINSIASQWGLEVVRIAGDGNCFFNSVAFQVSQLLSRCDLQTHVREHLYTLGISSAVSVPAISDILRSHLVAEWTGPFTEEYQQFVGEDVDFQQQAHAFLNSGVFASTIGDLMPLGLSNVLQIPILVLSTQNLVPFYEIYPRSSIGNGEAILLTFNHGGPGHYDALVHKNQHAEENNNEIHDNGRVLLNKEKTDNSNRGACRCGINAGRSKMNGPGKKCAYKSRCKCIPRYGSCWHKCKCKGHCGENGSCRVISSENVKGKRKSGNRKKQQIQSSPFKSSRIFYEERTNSQIEEPFNRLEFLIVMIIYVTLKGLNGNISNDYSSDVKKIYTKLIGLVTQHDFLCNLPLFDKTLEQIRKNLNKK